MGLLKFPPPERSEVAHTTESTTATLRTVQRNSRRVECPLGCEVRFKHHSEVDAHIRERHPGYFEQMARLLTAQGPDH
jgi:hypothetical protein